MILSHALHQTLRAFGFDYLRFNVGHHALARRQQLLQTYRVDLVLDVGANVGQFGGELRDLGYRGRIISFEPLASAYAALTRVAQADGAWQTLPIALGAAERTTTLHISGNSYSSSLLEMLPTHLELAPASIGVGEQTAQVQTLDALFENLRGEAGQVWLKIDTQGYELQVLKGAARSLAQIPTIQLEMSLVPLYRAAPLYQDCLAYLTARGYRLVSLEPGPAHPVTGELLQVDGIFHKP